ncbi:MAG: hypothetical protein EZS28_042746 [Streblomastix strix]|uniref:Uncharacterized protein n=1 Tax=Streblomastix strix TaxID=222440 RepID=A0A5J4TU09_9EUKA|nr:MAG: hypothetical protein EZS28_042746 [Streblomastix strix]
MLPENPIQPNSQQIQYQIREIDPQEEEDLEKQIFQLQEERDMIQLRFDYEVHDTVLRELDCPSDFDNNEMDKQSQSEDSEEAKDHLSIQSNKKKHTKMDKQNGNENENAPKAKMSLMKEKQKKNHKEMDKLSQCDDSQEFGTSRLKKSRARHKRSKKAKVQQPRKELNFNNMNEDQTRNLRSGTMLFQSKPEVMKERKQTLNKSNVPQDNHTSRLTQLNEELLTPKSIRVGLNVDSGMSNHPALRLKQFSLGSISSQPSLLWIRMERGNRMENHQVRNFKLSTNKFFAPKMKIMHSKEVLIFKKIQLREHLIMFH